jgi:LuxR family transcriptional regulator, maltose regulon positive regulatory protein
VKSEVTDDLAVISAGDPGATAGPPFEFWESKFHPPTARPGIVSRAALVNRLAAVRAPVITVVAPPGYGKTTLLAQWAKRVGPRVAWVSCDDSDNDPVVLLSALAVALDRIEPVEEAIFGDIASSVPVSPSSRGSCRLSPRCSGPSPWCSTMPRR